MAPLPLFKLGTLLVRTLSKPLAKRIKQEAANHPRISRWTIALGQFSHNITARLNVLASGYKLVGIKPLEEAEALNRGAEIIGEATIFTVATLVLVLEYTRQKNSDARKEREAKEIHDREQQEMQDKIDMLIRRIDDLEERLSAKSKWWGLYAVSPPKPKHMATSSAKPAIEAPAPTAATAEAVPVASVSIDKPQAKEVPVARATPVESTTTSSSSSPQPARSGADAARNSKGEKETKKANSNRDAQDQNSGVDSSSSSSSSSGGDWQWWWPFSSGSK